MKKTLLSLYLLLSCSVVFPQVGTLDESFGINGIARTHVFYDHSMYDNQCSDVLVNTDGSFYLVIQMRYQAIVAKRLPGGAPDLSFGEQGYSVPVKIVNPHGILQPDGKIVVGGTDRPYNSGHFIIARFNIDGSLDKSFSDDGITRTELTTGTDELNDLVLQPNGRIVAVGRCYDGSPRGLGITRYNPDGSADLSFSSDGKLVTMISGRDGAEGVAVQNDGRIIVTGYTESNYNSRMVTARYLPDGSPDISFAGGMTFVTAGWSCVGRAVAIQPDGKIVIGGVASGYSTESVLVKYNSDGSPDNSFSPGGVKAVSYPGGGQASISDLVLQPDNKILVTGYTAIPGYSEFFIARFDNAGNLDNTFSGDGMDVPNVSQSPDYSPGYSFSISLAGTGKMMIAGTYRYSMGIGAVRYLNNGTLDQSLDTDGILKFIKPAGITRFYASAVQPDGRVLAAGTAQTDYNSLAMVVVRHNIDGSPDNSFSDDGRLIVDPPMKITEVNAMLIQPDGKIVLAGAINTGITTDFMVVRLNPNGSLDNTFSSDGIAITDLRGYNDAAHGLSLQPDGKILAAGTSNLWGSDDDFAVVRYLPDGTPDNSFSGDGKVTTDLGSGRDKAFCMVLLPNGKIVVAGQFFNGLDTDFTAVKYNSDGSVDLSFTGDGSLIIEMNGRDIAYDLALQTDGKIIMAGDAGSNMGIVRFLETGVLDNSFSGDGKQMVDFGGYEVCYDVELQPGGKLFGAGRTSSPEISCAIFRLNVDGSLDHSFSEDGMLKITLGNGDESIYSLSLYQHRLYAAGTMLYYDEAAMIVAFHAGCQMHVTIPDAITLPSGVEPNTVYIGYAPASDLTLTAQAPPHGPATYLWSTGETTQSITVKPLVNTTYSVTVTHEMGCSGTAFKTVTVKDIRCGNKLDKVLVCHVPKGNSSNANTLCISANAVPAQLNNGSYLGSCTVAAGAARLTEIIEPTEESISIFPNPSSSVFNIDYSSIKNEPAELVVRDAGGRTIETIMIYSNRRTVIGGKYRPGIYYIEIIRSTTRLTRKLIKMQ